MMRYVTVVLVMLVNVSFFNSKYPFPLNEGMDFISSIRSLAFIFRCDSISRFCSVSGSVGQSVGWSHFLKSIV